MTRSSYVTMRDGVRLAVDVTLPKGLRAGTRIPTVLYQTRYWRRVGLRFPFNRFVDAHDLQGLLGTLRRAAVLRGYAWVDVDVRGSGASFGSRPWDYAPDEIQDSADLADWIVKQPWSSGRIATAGSSYSASTAEFALVNRHPAIRGAFIMSSEFDQYTDILFPGGIPLTFYLDGWGALTKSLDNNRVPAPDWKERLAVHGVARTDEDDGELVRQAVEQHQANYDFRELKRFVFRDDFLLGALSAQDEAATAAREAAQVSSFDWLSRRFGPDFRRLGVDLASPHTYTQDIQASGAAMVMMAGWYDGTYADAMIRRHRALAHAGHRLVIGPWDHHFHNISPHSRGGASSFGLQGQLLKFLDRTVGEGLALPDGDTPVHYRTLGAEVWRAAESWPPPSKPVHLHLIAGGRLGAETSDPGEESYTVDFTAGTGRHTRWDTVNGRTLRTPYPDRKANGDRGLIFLGEPLPQSIEVTGHPSVNLRISSTATDGAFFAYLDDVGPDGAVHHVTEGQLRALHRGVCDSATTCADLAARRTFRRADAVPLTPGQATWLVFQLLPTSYQFKAGHRIRLVLTGADVDHFGAVAQGGEAPRWTVFTGGPDHSSITLPVVEAAP